jgi:hypothetical protein
MTLHIAQRLAAWIFCKLGMEYGSARLQSAVPTTTKPHASAGMQDLTLGFLTLGFL